MKKMKFTTVSTVSGKTQAAAPATPVKSQPATPATIKAEPAKAAAPRTELAKTEAAKVGTSSPAKIASPKPNRVSLELVKPGAKQVCVAGSFNGWKPERTPLALEGNGRWVGDLAVNPGRHEYLFVVDGQWLPDPNAKESVQNPFGGRNSVLLVSA